MRGRNQTLRHPIALEIVFESYSSSEQNHFVGLQEMTFSAIQSISGIGLVAVLVSAFVCAPDGPSMSEGDLLAAITHTFLACLLLGICCLGNRGPNVVGNHGGIGLLVGILIAGVFSGSLKGAVIVVPIFSIIGAVFGLVIGGLRLLIGKSCSPRDATEMGRKNEKGHV